MVRRGGWIGEACPYCEEGRLSEKPVSAFEEGLDEYSDGFEEEWSGERLMKSFLCKSCGSEINQKELEALKRVLVWGSGKEFSLDGGRKVTKAM
jgi:hypothetical protein